MTKTKKIAILGAGLMGHGIAQIASQTGKFDVCIYARSLTDKPIERILDSLEKFKKKKLMTDEEVSEVLERIHVVSNLKDAVMNADFVIEVIKEDLPEKSAILKQVEPLLSGNAIVASGTSSIDINALAASLSHPENFCGMHFFNPPQLMKLVEVTKSKKTSEETIETVLEIARRMGKETVVIEKDSPGFIVNRILIHSLNEAASMYFKGIANRDDIDKAIKLGLNWPMGPLMLIDYIGADVVLAIINTLEKELPDGLHASEGLKQMVKANQLGRKTGKGFYDWTKG